MGKRTGAFLAIAALAVTGVACTGHGPSAVEGVTLYQVCGGVRPPEGVDPCQPPTPVVATVAIQLDETVIARVRSDRSGRFRVTLPAGTYTAQATLDPGGPFVDCPTEEIVVPTATPVTLTCRLLAP